MIFWEWAVASDGSLYKKAVVLSPKMAEAERARKIRVGDLKYRR